MSKSKFKKNTVGAIMKREFLAVPQDSTIEETINRFRSTTLEVVSKPSYIYVVDKDACLIGVIQVRDLLSRPPQTFVKDIMLKDVIKAQVHMDQEEAMRLFIKHKFLALPVVDRTQRLIGIITADEMVDIAELEAEEDIAKLIGTGVDEITTRSIPRIVRLRLPWLAFSILSGLICAFILGTFQYELKSVIALALFIPIVLGLF